MKASLLFLLLFIVCGDRIADAQTPQLVEDLWQGSATKSSLPSSLTAFGDRLLFGATDSLNGSELWEWEMMGKPAKRLTNNGQLAYPGCITDKRMKMPVMNGAFFGSTPSTGQTLLLRYKAGGTVDTIGNGSSVNFSSMCQLGSKMYYFVDTGSLGGFLTSYDGSNPPVRIKYFKKIAAGSNWYPLIVAYRNKLYFEADTAGLGAELFCFDPATNAATLIADIRTGSGSSYPRAFAVGGSKLYFTAQDSAHGEELYSYNGNTVNRLTDIVSGTGNGIAPAGGNTSMKYHNGGIFFAGVSNSTTGQKSLFRYDTATGLATKVYDPFPTDNSSYPFAFLSTPNNLFFLVSNNLSTNPGIEIHKYDGKSFSIVADLNPGQPDGVNSNLELFQGYVYFAGNNGATGYELYRLKDSATGVGIQKVGWEGSAVVYPNPASLATTLVITLQHPESIRVTLSDMQGRKVWAADLHKYPVGKSEVSIPMQSLADGQYFYRLNDDSGRILAGAAIMKQ